MNEIIISPASIEIIDTSKLTDKHVVIVYFDIGNLPTTKAQKFLEDRRDEIRKIIPESTKIIVAVKDRLQIKIEKQE